MGVVGRCGTPLQGFGDAFRRPCEQITVVSGVGGVLGGATSRVKWVPSTAVLQAVLQVLQAVLQSISSKTTRLIQNLPKSSSTTHSQRSHASGIAPIRRLFFRTGPGAPGVEPPVLHLAAAVEPRRAESLGRRLCCAGARGLARQVLRTGAWHGLGGGGGVTVGIV